MRPPARRLDARLARAAVSTSLCYFACASAALLLTRFDGGLAVAWCASAFLFARLSAAPRRWRLPLVLACVPAGIAAAVLFGFGHGMAVPLAVVSVLEGWVASATLKRLCPRFGRFQSVSEVVRFLAVAGIAVPGASAFVGAWCAYSGAGAPYWATWRDWYAVHALGMVVFAPPFVLALRGEVRRWTRSAERKRLVEAAGLLGAVLAAAAVTFGQNRVPIVVVPFVPMIAATFRLGRFGAVASLVILVGVGMGCTLAGHGPTTLLAGGMVLKLQLLQTYLATAVLILLPVAAELAARRRLLDRLKAAEALHRLILDRTSDVVFRLGIEGDVRYASPSAERVSGYAPGELIGRSAFGIVHAADVAGVREARDGAVARPEGFAVIEYRIVRADGQAVWVESHIRATTDEDGRITGTVSIVREVTERRRAVEDLERRASTDPLTGLANRRAFDEALDARLRAARDGARPGCLAIFDIDHFKLVNDRHGHAAGDAVLVRFADVLRASVRDGDVVARIGGEEFGVLLDGADVEQAARICERIRAKLEARDHPADGAALPRATASAGIAPLTNAATAAEVVRAADDALYRAKRAGRNRLALAA